MKKIEEMALKEINQKSSNIRMTIYGTKSHLASIKQTLMSCGQSMSKECLTELISEAHKAISELEQIEADNVMIGEWADSLKQSC
jgi:hypothetical protein